MKWKENELNFLQKNYHKYGPFYCSKILNRSGSSVSSKSKRMGLKYDMSIVYKSDIFKEVVNNSSSYSDICKNLNLPSHYGNRQTIKKYIEYRNLDISHFFNKELIPIFKKIELKYILIENSTYRSTTCLKKRLYKEGLKERKCELCGQEEKWKGKKMSLIIDHINGTNNDNRIENLRIVCPNCNATLDTHCGKNIKNKSNNYYLRIMGNKKKYFCDCGDEITKNAKVCIKCSQINQRKVERPTYKQLSNDIKELNYTNTGKKYGVSDNTIRKWKRKYEGQLGIGEPKNL